MQRALSIDENKEQNRTTRFTLKCGVVVCIRKIRLIYIVSAFFGGVYQIRRDAVAQRRGLRSSLDARS